MSAVSGEDTETAGQRARSALDPGKWIIPAERFRNAQRRHFLLSNVIPVMGTLIGFAVLPSDAFGVMGVTVWASMWTLVGGLGVSVGFHRLFAHRAFVATPFTRYLLGALGSMAAQGSVIYWTALHRRHHSFSDQPGDPHSPTVRATGASTRAKAFLHGHMGWAAGHAVPKPSRYTRDLLADPVATRLSRHYCALVFLGFALPALAGYTLWGSTAGLVYGAFWGGFVRVAIGHQIIWSINSVCHAFGGRTYPTSDESRNNAWLAVISFGESWHNNHHHDASSARFGRRWHQVDIGWLMIRAMRHFGMVSQVRS